MSSYSPRVWVKELTFNDGTTISIDQNDILVIVGSNNSGKSQSLRDINANIRNIAESTTVISDLKIEIAGSTDALINWLDSRCRKNLSQPSNPTYTRMGASVSKSQAQSWWNSPANGLNSLANFYVKTLTTEERLTAANPASNIKLTTDPISHPIHFLQIDDKVEKKMSSFFSEAFGEDLVVHRNAGREVPLLCGTKPKPKRGDDRVSVAYLEELEKLDYLHQQGDGMRSFVGVLLHSFITEYSVLLIDEPEAFLHPPQARLLGQMIVNELPKNRQLFLASHSGDFLRGLLDTNSSRVRIIRINRKGSINPVKNLDNREIKAVWKDSILRHSNVLDGIFHSKVIICESDSDCRFYAAIMDTIVESSKIIHRDHIMFLHCGGKNRMPTVINALKKIGVPISVVSDFDIINNENPLSYICDSLGGNWQELKGTWKIVKSAVEMKKPELSTEEFRTEIKKELDAIKEEIFPQSVKKRITNLLRRTSPWSIAKSVGKAYIPSGDATIAYTSLDSSLKDVGLFIVPVGEIEGFCKSVGKHGPEWVNRVLEKDIVNDEEFDPAKRFIKEIMEN